MRTEWLMNLEHQKMRVYVNLRKTVYKIKYKRFHPEYSMSHITFYSAGNAGDTALSTCIRDLFNKEVGRISWSLTSMVKPVNNKYIESMNRKSAIVVGGHGAFMPDTNENQISGWEWACSKEQYGQISLPIIVFAIGYNYFTGQTRETVFEENVQALVKRSDFFGLRNRGSVRLVQSLVDESLKSKVEYQPCPTMIARNLYPMLPDKVETGKVAFNVALDRAKMRMGTNQDVILDEIAKSMYLLSLRGYEMHFVTHCDTEIPFTEYLKKYDVKYKLHSASSWGASKLIAFYNKMDVVVGMRGHGIWIPFGVNCHIISLGNQNKTKWFLEDINALDWYIDINENPHGLCNQIIEKFIYLHEVNGSDTTRRLLEEQNKLYMITMENMKKIKKVINPTVGYGRAGSGCVGGLVGGGVIFCNIAYGFALCFFGQILAL